ncbi:hypothetical protein NM688_g7028 [Phlebia brevispora]|uniref:Uncharacterized protein n=1 Tax=Phlebia brevispora TaxID=194682 RepID=A0ACC1S9Q3_9APHY|nr:hypothetical protein NM688_g7028 [Phlebia brevispora]
MIPQSGLHSTEDVAISSESVRPSDHLPCPDRSETQYTVPQEICDMVIDQFTDDRTTLKACSLVCRGWVHRSRTHLFNSMHVSVIQGRQPRIYAAHKDFWMSVISSPRVTTYIKELRIDMLRAEYARDTPSDEGVAMLWQTLALFQHVSTLNICGLLCSSESTQPADLARLASSFPFAQTLLLHGCHFDNAEAETYFISSFTSLTNVACQRLSFQAALSSHPTAGASIASVQALQRTLLRSSLVSLEISSCFSRFGPQLCRCLADLCSHTLRKFTLEIDDGYRDMLDQFLEAMSPVPLNDLTIAEPDMRVSHLSATDFQYLQKQQNLRILRLILCGPSVAIDALQNVRCDTLRDLTVAVGFPYMDWEELTDFLRAFDSVLSTPPFRRLRSLRLDLAKPEDPWSSRTEMKNVTTESVVTLLPQTSGLGILEVALHGEEDMDNLKRQCFLIDGQLNGLNI